MTGRTIHIVLAVHGIGQQRAGETTSELVHQLGNRLGGPSHAPPGRIAQARRLGMPWFPAPGRTVGFSEVHWAGIAGEHTDLASSNIVHWSQRLAHQVAAFDEERKPGGVALGELPTIRISRVVEDTVLTARFSRFFLAMARLETDGMVSTARHFVASYQVFVEHEEVRHKIVKEFCDTVIGLSRYCDQEEADGNSVRIHVIAHSLGCVIAFLGLGRLAGERNSESQRAMRRVRTFCTMGSPLDLFLTIHPELFRFANYRARHRGTQHAIRWANFVEEADPIASTCAVTARLLEMAGPTVFQADHPADYEYGHAVIPGGAHTAYWSDQVVMDQYWDFLFDEGGLRRRRLGRIQRGHRSALVILGMVCASALATGTATLVWAENFGLLDERAVAAPASAEVLDKLGRYGALIAWVSACVMTQAMLGSSMRSTARPSHILGFVVPFFLTVLGFIHYAQRTLESGRLACWVATLMIAVSVYQLIQDTLRRGHQRAFNVVFGIGLLLSCNLLGLVFTKLGAADVTVIVLARGVLYSIAVASAWYFTTLWWRLLIVWARYVMGRLHIDFLASRWSGAIARLAGATTQNPGPH